MNTKTVGEAAHDEIDHREITDIPVSLQHLGGSRDADISMHTTCDLLVGVSLAAVHTSIRHLVFVRLALLIGIERRIIICVAAGVSDAVRVITDHVSLDLFMTIIVFDRVVLLIDTRLHGLPDLLFVLGPDADHHFHEVKIRVQQREITALGQYRADQHVTVQLLRDLQVIKDALIVIIQTQDRQIRHPDHLQSSAAWGISSRL